MRSNSELNGLARHQSPPRSEVYFTVSASSASGVRIFTYMPKYVGSVLRPIMDPTYGWAVQVMLDGVYSVNYIDTCASTSSATAYVLLNTTSSTIPTNYSTVIAYSSITAAGGAATISASNGGTTLRAGDILYPVPTGSFVDSGGNSFRVTHVAWVFTLSTYTNERGLSA